ncbi:MAG TPA: hypothetical protein VLV17_03530 [Anaeromyxobacteraceae bacterium]|nr:hypothetical protein [Anaeromyxobacteraceae bacterium]
MKSTRIVAILILSFLFGGGSAEVAVNAQRALHRRLTSKEEGQAGELVAFEIQRDDGEVVARPRVIASPGHVAQLVLRDPEDPNVVRLTLRVATTREASGDISVDYLISLPAEELVCRGRVSMPFGEERKLDLGKGPLTATLVAVPVPSAAFDAFLKSERASRRTVLPI